MNTTSPELLNQLRLLKDQEAWVTFVHIYYQSVSRWIREFGSISQNSEIEDLVQEVFIIIFQKVGHFEREREGSFRKWIKLIVRNVVLQKLQKDLRQNRGGQFVVEDIPEKEAAAELADDRLELIEQAIRYVKKDFSVNSWNAFELLYYQGLSPKEVAARLDITENSVYIATSRILGRIRSVIDQFVDK